MRSSRSSSSIRVFSSAVKPRLGIGSGSVGAKYGIQSSLCYFQYFRLMGRVNTPLLSESAKTALEEGFKVGKTHAFRTRCQVILLKATGRTSADVALITSMTYVSVNAWVKRYRGAGLVGLQTAPGRGRKRLLTEEADKETVLKAVTAHRQRLQTAKAKWEQENGRTISSKTLKSFLKALTDDIKG